MQRIEILNCEDYFPTGKIVCVGRNYAEHAAELGNEILEFPLIFLKPTSAIINSGTECRHPKYGNDLSWETELVLLIGKDVSECTLEEAEEAIAGYAVGFDMTLRDKQNELKGKGHPWTLAKCFDDSAILGDFVLKSEYKLDLENEILLEVNGTVKQKSKLNLMLHKPAEIVKYLASMIKLEKGDLVFTGTPGGVGKAVVGDKLIGSIKGLPIVETEIV